MSATKSKEHLGLFDDENESNRHCWWV